MKEFFRRIDIWLGTKPRLPWLFLRIGLAIVFIYAAISSTVSPEDWVGYLPSMLTDHIPAKTVLPVFSIYEVLLAVWLLSGVWVRYAALLTAATLGGIVVANLSLLPISFRDIGLVFAALALAFAGDADSQARASESQD